MFRVGAMRMPASRKRLWLVCLLLLPCGAGCAAPGQPYEARVVYGQTAPAYCTAQGYRAGSYDYESCFRNRPEIQAYERKTRLDAMNIIVANRSPRAVPGLSLPVE